MADIDKFLGACRAGDDITITDCNGQSFSARVVQVHPEPRFQLMLQESHSQTPTFWSSTGTELKFFIAGKGEF